MSPFLSGFLALVVLLPAVVLLGWLEHRCDSDGASAWPERRRTTWPREDIEA